MDAGCPPGTPKTHPWSTQGLRRLQDPEDFLNFRNPTYLNSKPQGQPNQTYLIAEPKRKPRYPPAAFATNSNRSETAPETMAEPLEKPGGMRGALE